MNIAIVGTGYVGLVAGVCFADAGHRVTCIDNDPRKITTLTQGQSPIYEPGLNDLLQRSRARLKFDSDLEAAVNNNEVIFIAVGTPETEDGSADLGPTRSVLKAICDAATEKKFIVLKSTVPVGTAKELQTYCGQNGKAEHEIINNPEFLREGCAINDFLNPDRIVIGAKSKQAKELMRALYSSFMKNGNPIYFMDNASAEMTKYAANSFLALKISFINEMALLADKVGADITAVRQGFTSDQRINPSFFYPGVGYGGSCFPKDVKALVHVGKQMGITMHLNQASDAINERQKKMLFEKIKEKYGDIKGKTFALWGLAFKPGTDDVREAPALVMIDLLDKAGAKVKAYDPEAMETAKEELPSVDFMTCSTAMEATEGADALVIMTEWNEFKNPDFNRLKENLTHPDIFDGRGVFEPSAVKNAGFSYYCLGRMALN